MKRTEAFIEQRPVTVGTNLRHWRTSPTHFGRHFTNGEYPCQPERVPHTKPKEKS